jgi:energy-coupling factor transporter ATP-binding protein EcfA2
MSHGNVKYDVFLSYNSRDREQVENIARRLNEQGLKVFLDRWYLTPGKSWQKELERILAECGAVAVCLGPHGMGRWQHSEMELAIDRHVRDEKFSVIPVLLPGGDPPLGFLSLTTWVDFRPSFHHAEPLMLLALAIRGLPPGPEFTDRITTAMADVCPYRGLRYFREEDAPFFFGRDTFIEGLITKVRDHSLVAVVGPSGSGKSSVVRAGLVPHLRRGANNKVWDVLTMVPGDDPLKNLAHLMVRLLEPEMEEVDRLERNAKLAKLLLTGEVRLLDVVNMAIEKQAGTDRLMLIVDQFEELYTLTRDESARQKFIEEILHATASGPLSIVLTLRGDFYGDLVSQRSISDRLQDAVLNVSTLTPEELTEVIEQPAQKVGLGFQEGLVKRILGGVKGSPGNLPLLEFVLMELWKARQSAELTHAAYEEMGEIDGAIAKHAETAFAAFSPAEQEIARRVFLQLVRPGGDLDLPDPDAEPTRRRTSFSELRPEALPVVRQLANDHLLVTGRNEATGEEIVDLVHEALIKAWDRLREWIHEDRELLAWREKMRTYVNVAAARDFEKSTLLRGHLLQEAKGWFEKREVDLSVGEKQLIAASIGDARFGARLKVAAGLGIVILIAAAGFGIYKSGAVGSRPNSALPVAPSRNSNPNAPAPVSSEGLRIRQAEIRQLIGVTSLEMNGPRTVALIGPAPAQGTLPPDQMEVIEAKGIDPRQFDQFTEYVSRIVQCIQQVAPDARFVFIRIRVDSNMPADLNSVMAELNASQNKPGVLLAPYMYPDSNAADTALQLIANQGILVITAGLTEGTSFQGPPMREQFMTVGSVNLKGERSQFSHAADGLFWSPGEDLLVRTEDGNLNYNGTGPAAGIAAGVAIRILDRYPQLTPAELIQTMRATSQVKAPNGPPVVNLDAALGYLFRNRPR